MSPDPEEPTATHPPGMSTQRLSVIIAGAAALLAAAGYGGSWISDTSTALAHIEANAAAVVALESKLDTWAEFPVRMARIEERQLAMEAQLGRIETAVSR